MRIIESRLAQFAIACVVLAALSLALLSYLIYEPERQKQAAVRVEMDAAAIAAPVNRALAVGIPLEQMQGVDAFFLNRLKSSPHLQSIELRARDGRVLWKQGEAIADQIISAKVPLVLEEQAVGEVVINASFDALQPASVHAVLILAAAILAAGLMLYETIRFVLQRGTMSRDSVVRHACAAMQAGNWRQIFSGERRHEQDERAQWLRTQVRLINERFERIERLVASLRRTEPSRAGRARLDQVLDTARGRDQFAQGRPATIRVEAFFSEVRWLGVLVLSAAESMRILALAEGEGLMWAYSLGVGLAGLLAGALGAPRLFSRATRYVAILAACSLVILGMLIAGATDAAAGLLAARCISAFGAGCLIWCFDRLHNGAPAGAVLKDNESLTWRHWSVLAGAELIGPAGASLLVPLAGRSGSLLLLAAVCCIGMAILFRGDAKAFWRMPAASVSASLKGAPQKSQAVAGFALGVLWLHWLERSVPLLDGVHDLGVWSLALAGWTVLGLAILMGYQSRKRHESFLLRAIALWVGAVSAVGWLFLLHGAYANYAEWLFLIPTAAVAFAVAQWSAEGRWFVSLSYFYGGALAAVGLSAMVRVVAPLGAANWLWLMVFAGLAVCALQGRSKHAA